MKIFRMFLGFIICCIVLIYLSDKGILPDKETLPVSGRTKEDSKRLDKSLIEYCWLRKTTSSDGANSTFLRTKYCESLQDKFEKKYHEKPVSWR